MNMNSFWNYNFVNAPTILDQRWLSSAVKECFATTRSDPRNYTHVSGSSYAWLILPNTKQCYLQITHDGTHMYGYTANNNSLANPPPCLILLPFI
jgi:hypothetical protein